MYELERITIETVSAIVCFVLVRFMIKPFRLTGETRYLGLPLGFGFLGISYAFSALLFTSLFDFANIGWIQLFVRATAFLFLAVTYYFSKSESHSKSLWNIALGLILAVFTVLILFVIISPKLSFSDYMAEEMSVRILNLICLSYVSIHALKSHTDRPDPTTLMIPLGYILLGIGQYSILIWAIDASLFAFFGGLAIRLMGLAVFLIVSYRAFYGSKKGGINEKN